MNQAVLRELNQVDYDQSIQLSTYSFQYTLSESEVESHRSQFLAENDTRYGVFADNQLCAQAILLHFETYIAGKLIKMGGLAGVCTAPEHRRSGYVAQIITRALNDMKQNGEVISMLHPFAFSFYRKFGWECYIEYKSYEMKAEHLSSILRNRKNKPLQGSVRRTSDYNALPEIYANYAKQFNGMLHRDEAWWSKIMNGRKKGFIAIYSSNEGDDEGYIIYQIANREMIIHEVVTTSSRAQHELWLFIAQHDSMIDLVKWTAPSSDTFTYTLDNPRIKQEVTPYFMARIVDLEGFISQYPFNASEEELTFTLFIQDDKAAWNNGLFTLTIDKQGKGQLLKSFNTEPELTMDIGALTAIMLNYCNLETNVQAGRAVAANHSVINRFQNRLSAQPSYLTDFF